MNYYFSDLEKSAIVRVGVEMEAIDGVRHPNESVINIIVFSSLQIESNHIEQAKSMSMISAMEVIKNMTQNEKKYICSYLASIMCSDKDIDDKELTLWKLISTICEFPEMHIAEALKYFNEHFNK